MALSVKHAINAQAKEPIRNLNTLLLVVRIRTPLLNK